jgi:hypothetical protein
MLDLVQIGWDWFRYAWFGFVPFSERSGVDGLYLFGSVWTGFSMVHLDLVFYSLVWI